MSRTKRKIINSVFWLGGSNLLSQVVTWIFTILIARILKPEDFGLVAMASVYIGFTEYLNEFGIGAAIVQRKDLNREEVKGVYTASILFGIFLCGISFAVAHLLAAFFNEERLVAIIYILSSTFIISAVKNVQQNLMIRDMKFKQIANIEVIARITTSLVSYFFAVAGMGAWTLVYSYLLYNIAQAILYAFHERQRPGRIENFSQVKSILHFGMQVMLARIIGVLSQRTDTFVIGKLIGKEALGVYSFSLSLANKPIDKIMSILNQVLFPVFAKAQEDLDAMRRYFLKILEVELLIMLPVFALLALSADSLVPVLLGEKWLGVILPFKVFAIGGIFMYLSSVGSMVVVAIGRPKMQVYYNAAILVIITSGMIAAGFFYRLEGVIFSWAVLYPLITLSYFYFVIRALGIDVKSVLLRFRLPLLLTAMMAIAVTSYDYFMTTNGWPKLLSILILGSLTYLLALVTFDRGKAAEILDLLRSRSVGLSS